MPAGTETLARSEAIATPAGSANPAEETSVPVVSAMREKECRVPSGRSEPGSAEVMSCRS